MCFVPSANCQRRVSSERESDSGVRTLEGHNQESKGKGDVGFQEDIHGLKPYGKEQKKSASMSSQGYVPYIIL